jgi:predicted transcriptional regulator
VGRIISALASMNRRQLLECLADRDGQRLMELCVSLAISKQATMKHIDVLADCGLVTIKRFGRETRVFLNRAPLKLVQRNFLDRFTNDRIDSGADADQVQKVVGRSSLARNCL